MLTVLSNVGKLLTKGLKYPFFLVKRWGRRLFRYCTKMTRDQILEADAKDLSRLEVRTNRQTKIRSAKHTLLFFLGFRPPHPCRDRFSDRLDLHLFSDYFNLGKRLGLLGGILLLFHFTEHYRFWRCRP